MSKYVNSDSNEVLCLKVAGCGSSYDKNHFRAFIKIEEIWSEIKGD
jgi:hypothetical protein